MNREALKHLHNGGQVHFADDLVTLIDPAPSGPSIEELIEQGYLSPTGRLRQSAAMRFGELLKNAGLKPRKIGMPPEMAAPYGHSCPDLNAIYGADVYTRGALECQGATISALKESLAGAHRSTARYMALAFLGWAAVVIMGVVL